MKIRDSEHANQLVDQLAEAVSESVWGGSRYRVRPSGKDSIKIGWGSTEYTLRLGPDGIVRVPWVNEYGNVEGVHGWGCDASGLRIDRTRQDNDDWAMTVRDLATGSPGSTLGSYEAGYRAGFADAVQDSRSVVG